MSARPEHLLSAATRLWADVGPELEASKAAQGADLADAGMPPAEDLKKVAKWFQHGVTKFSASAAVADGNDAALRPIAEEVVKAFTAAAGTLLAFKKGAGACLLKELRLVGNGMAEAVDQLGAAVGTPELAMCAGKALTRAKQLEKLSAHNRGSIRRVILRNLGQLSDAGREMKEVLKKADAEKDGDASDEDDDFDDFDEDEDLDPEERLIVEGVVALVEALEDALKQASLACVPPKDGDAGAPLAQLEAVAEYSEKAANGVDSLAAHAIGGLDPDAFAASLQELRDAVPFFGAPVVSEATVASLEAGLSAIQTALDAAGPLT